MGKILDDRHWGVGLKISITIIPIFCSFASGAFIYIYSSINHLSKQMEIMNEWRRSHEELSARVDRRIEMSERSIQNHEVELAVFKSNLQQINMSLDKVSKSLDVISRQSKVLQSSADRAEADRLTN